MSGPRVLLMQLSERVSAKGTAYMSGWLGKAQVVAFKAKEPDKYGNEVWEVFVSEPAPKADSDQRQAQPTRGRSTWDRSRNAERHATWSKAQAAGEAVLAAAGRERAPEPPQGWLDDSAAAIADLEGRDQ